MTKRIFLKTLVCTAAITLLGAANAQDNTFKVGLILPMTGPFTSTGKQLEAAAKLYVAQHGDTVGGRKLVLIVRDDTGEPEVTKRIAQDLVVNEKVQVLAGFGLTPLAMASACERPSTFSCARHRFSMIRKCGNNSKCWNTMPTWLRNLGRLVLGSASEMPSTTMSPFWNGSSALTVLISVDLPEPDGPQTTTTSPFLMAVVQSVSTWKLPYHLEMFWIWITAVSSQRMMAIFFCRRRTSIDSEKQMTK
mgnify:CR=1 FL=1